MDKVNYKKGRGYMRELNRTIDEIRNFNRFYTVNMGFLYSTYLETEYSVIETRILFEINIHGRCTQSDIAKNLSIDKSYLSRIIKHFYSNGLIEKDKSIEDKRAICIALTEKGSMETKRLIDLTNQQIMLKINKLSDNDCDKLCHAMNTIISILGKEEEI